MCKGTRKFLFMSLVGLTALLLSSPLLSSTIHIHGGHEIDGEILRENRRALFVAVTEVRIKVSSLKSQELLFAKLHRIRLVDGSELTGRLKTLPDGNLAVGGNPYVSRQAIITRAMVDETFQEFRAMATLTDELTVEGVVESNVAGELTLVELTEGELMPILKDDIDTFHPNRSHSIASKNQRQSSRLRRRFMAAGFVAAPSGTWEKILPRGQGLELAIDLPLTVFNRYWFMPGVRSSIAYGYYRNEVFSMAHSALQVGPVWRWQPWRMPIQFSLAHGSGLAMLNIKSFGFSARTLVYSGSVSAALEVPVRTLVGFMRLSANYAHDPNSPFVDFRILSGVGYAI